MNLWNIKNLPVPPINTFKALDKSIDIKHLRNVFLEGKNFFDDQKYMDAEYAILSRIVYRSKQKFRSAKDFKALEKLQKALYNYFKTNISLDMQNFIELVPVRYKDETYLPDKNLLDYILVRLQGLAKLLERMVETCKITAGLFDGRISLGHFWKQGLLAFSLVSRIYILAKYSTKFICALYNKILPFSSKLKNTGRKWLPEDYILPTDLHQWMNVDWLEIDDELQIVETSVLHNVDIMEFLDLVDDEDIQYCGEYILVDDNGEGLNEYNSLRNVANIKQRIQAMRGFDAEDVGEVIEVKDDSLFIQENDEYVSDGLQEEIDDSVLVPNEESSKCNTSQVGICDNLMKKAVDIVEIDDSFEASGKQVSLQKDEVIVLDDSVAPYSKDIGEEFKDTDNSDVITILDESLSSGLDNKDFGTFFLDNKGELSTSKDKLSNKKKLKVVKAALNKSVHKIAKKTVTK
ncbi:hypothetical protein NQ315_000967 [Exocentrus adspersus]|uniref:Nucleolus and neural progenitor protein-like N-terminal domain-containing protein n=1 Tax=Exocentrus adspersus TaxID=1586481 RepID=A0AAV8WEP5_9CUCU|nr:hypothetical protein NQ315_000967 [Exocentrus adspersus]